VQFDYIDFDSDRAIFKDDSELRRAELVVRGKHASGLELTLGYDAKADKFLDASLKDRFGAHTTWRIGQFKQPNSLEELSSTKNNDFVAKAMTTNLQGVARRMGVQLATGGDNWTLAGSLFDREMTRRLAQGRGYGVRGTFAPVNESGRLLHLGGSYVNYEAMDAFNDNYARFRVRPGADLAAQRLVDSGNITDADRIATLGGEAVWVQGPVKLQAEVMRTNVGRSAHDDYDFSSWYVSGLWNVNGETWGYKNGVISTSLPDDPAAGMWQLGARYDHVDLDDDGIAGGKESNWTLGANYYWRSNFKFMLNYVKVDSERNNVDDDPSIVEFRGQFYW
jgi:phosphate-selective porin OprO/OprP